MSRRYEVLGVVRPAVDVARRRRDLERAAAHDQVLVLADDRPGRAQRGAVEVVDDPVGRALARRVGHLHRDRRGGLGAVRVGDQVASRCRCRRARTCRWRRACRRCRRCRPRRSPTCRSVARRPRRPDPSPCRRTRPRAAPRRSPGVAVAPTTGGALTAAPLPLNRNQLRFISDPVAVGWRNTTNSWCVPCGTSRRSRSTFVHVCQPPVGASRRRGDQRPVRARRGAAR